MESPVGALSSTLLRVMSLLEGGPTSPFRAEPGRTRPPGARLRAPTPGLAPGWGPWHIGRLETRQQWFFNGSLEAFFSRRKQEGETLQEFSLALMGLMEKVKQHTPAYMLDAEALLSDQFVEHVLDSSLRRELKQLVHRQPNYILLDVRAEAICWEREGSPGGMRGRSHSIPSVFGVQYGVQCGFHHFLWWRVATPAEIQLLGFCFVDLEVFPQAPVHKVLNKSSVPSVIPICDEANNSRVVRELLEMT
ncbi:hypothetical protein L3Q82_007864 [Scortum barcoo]|uniref:Uncharacterized protein n=1 Tax=Scortum barcoo TaxID=214431 RepID=A0ACB8WJY8_9TELE|nr:hypothetical protein L3Q82_007864 [Scortum barcoo]